MPESSPAFHSVALERGWTLHHRRSDRFKTELLRLFFRAPLLTPSAEHQLFAALMSRSTESLPTRRELAARLRSLYGAGYGASLQRLKDRQILSLRASTVSGRFLPGRPDNLGAMLGFLGEALRGPALDPDGLPKAEVFEQERRELMVDLLGRKNNKSRWALIRAREELLGASHPLARPAQGTEEEIQAATAAGTLAVGMRTLREAPVDLYLCAPCSTAEAEALVRRHLELNPRKPERFEPLELPAPKRRARTVVESARVEQGKLVLAFRHPTWDRSVSRPLCGIADLMLGGTFSAKLFKNVREKKSLCYDISSQLDANHGLWFVSLGIESVNKDKAIKAVKAEMQKLLGGDFTEEEVQTARRTLASAVEGVSDTQNGLVEFFYQRHLDRRRQQSIAAIVRDIERVAGEDIPTALAGFELDTVYFLEKETKGRKRA